VSGAVVYAIKFLPGDRVIVMTMNTSPYIQAYEWDNTTGFGAKFDDPAEALPGISNSLDFFPA